MGGGWRGELGEIVVKGGAGKQLATEPQASRPALVKLTLRETILPLKLAGLGQITHSWPPGVKPGE
jgi:hypothetical protein